jgi:hypothetical protein
MVLPEILDVRVHLIGTACCHEITGGDVTDPFTFGTVCYDPGLVFGLVNSEELVYRTVNKIPGDFDNSGQAATCTEQEIDQEYAFNTGSVPADWSFLATGEGTLFLTGLPGPFCSYPRFCTPGPSMSLTAAELIIEIPMPTPLEEHPWGTLKAIYR